MSTQPPRHRRPWAVALGIVGQFCQGLFWIALLGSLLAIAYLSTFGFPDWLMTKVKSILNAGPVAIDATTMKYRPPFRIVVSDARVFWKGRIGPPAAEAKNLSIKLNPAALWEPASPIRSMTIRDGVFRPDMIAPAAGAEAPGEKPPAPLSVRMGLNLSRCEVWGQHVESLSCLLRIDGFTVNVLDVRAVLQEEGRTGRFACDFKYDAETRDFTGHVRSLSDPRVLLPIIEAHDLAFLAELTQRFEFRNRAPDVDVQFRTKMDPQAPFFLAGSFALRDSSYLGVPFRSADGQLQVDLTSTSSVVRVGPLAITRDEGTGKGGFSVVDRNNRRYVEFDATSALDPQAVTAMIGIMTNGFWDACRIQGPYEGWARGYVNYEDISDSDFRGQLRLGAFGNDLMMLTNCTCDLAMIGATILVENVQGNVCGGTVTGAVAVVLPTLAATDTLYRVTGQAHGVDFQSLERSCIKAGATEARGILSASFDLSGAAESNLVNRMRGNGSVRIENGRVFMLPIFGGFSKFMTRIIPGLDFILRQSDVKARFAIDNGKIASDDVRIEGEVFSLNAKGVYGLDRSLDFNVKVQLMKQQTLVAKLLNTAIYPISRLFEMKLTGTADAPQWHAVNFSLDVFDKFWTKLGETVGVHSGSKNGAEPEVK